MVSCYEAGPDGFWIHRYLITLGVESLVVDPASIEVNRRGRQAKTDRLDVERLVALLLRYVNGETAALRVVRVPSEEAEHRRQLHREFITTTQDRVRVRNRMKGLLATQGLHVPVRSDFATRLPGVRRWDGQPLPAGPLHLGAGPHTIVGRGRLPRHGLTGARLEWQTPRGPEPVPFYTVGTAG